MLSYCLINGLLSVLASWGRCGSGVETASCYRKVAGLIPVVCMSKCPWARY